MRFFLCVVRVCWAIVVFDFGFFVVLVLVLFCGLFWAFLILLGGAGCAGFPGRFWALLVALSLRSPRLIVFVYSVGGIWRWFCAVALLIWT